MSKGVTRQKVVEAALELLNDTGIEGVTVRALAERLDVRAPALYWHLRNKRELLDEMSTAVLRRIADVLPASSSGWREDLVTYARVLRAEYLRHRDGARIFSGARVSDPEVVVRIKEPLYRNWTEAGFTLPEIDDAIDVIVAFVVGFVIEEQERLQSAEADPSRYSLAERDEGLGGDAPLARAAGHLRDDGDQRFERHLGIVLDGLAARHGRGDPPKRSRRAR